MSLRVGLVGARGYVGSELIRLLLGHPNFELVFVSSRERAGQQLSDYQSGYSGPLRYVNFDATEAAGQGVDALILALPNGKAKPFVDAVDQQAADTVILDLSADYRFDGSWYYGLPELTRAAANGAKRISNPGCYATAMQLALAPLRGALSGAAQCFGVSGYSGAGTTPSDKNDPDKLAGNLMPYSLTGHLHEREVSMQMQHPVEFMPHVAAHFSGIMLTANLHLSEPMSQDDVLARYRDFYKHEPMVRVLNEAPWVSRIAGRHHAELGGFTLSGDGRRLVLIATLDNLLKGAATQAMQNLNLAFGEDETRGIPAIEVV